VKQKLIQVQRKVLVVGALPLRRKDVADLSGTTLHTASRILTVWRKAGLLVSHQQRLIIRQPSGILRIAEDLTG
jgi:CRP-like cAMP-binding protein